MDDPFGDNGKDRKGFYDDTGAAVPPPTGIAALDEYVVEASRSRRSRPRSARDSASQAVGDGRQDPDVASTDAFPPLPGTVAPRTQQSISRLPAELTRAMESTQITSTPSSQPPATPRRDRVADSYAGLYTFDYDRHHAFPHDNEGGNFHISARANKDVMVYQYKREGPTRSWAPISVIPEIEIPRFKQELDVIANMKTGKTEGEHSDHMADSQVLSLVNLIGKQPSLFQPDIPAGGASQSPAYIISPRRLSNPETDPNVSRSPVEASTERSILIEEGRQSNAAVEWMNENPLKVSQSYQRYLDQFNTSPQRSQGSTSGGRHRRRTSNLASIDETAETVPPSGPSQNYAQYMPDRREGTRGSLGSSTSASASASAGRAQPSYSGPIPGQQPVTFPRSALSAMNTGNRAQQRDNQPGMTTPTRNPAQQPAFGVRPALQSTPMGSQNEPRPGSRFHKYPNTSIMSGGPLSEQALGWYPGHHQTKEQYEAELDDFWNSGKKGFDELQGRVTDSLAAKGAPISREKETSLRLMTSIHANLQSYAFPRYQKDADGNPLPVADSITRGSPFAPLPPPRSNPQSTAPASQTQHQSTPNQQQTQPGQPFSLTPRPPPARPATSAPKPGVSSTREVAEEEPLPGLAPTMGIPRHAIGTLVPAVPRVVVPPHNCPPTPPMPGASTVTTSECPHTSVGRWCRFCNAHVVRDPPSASK